MSRRVYPMVPGYLDRFATIDSALEAAHARVDFREEGEQLADARGWPRKFRAGEWTSSEATARGVALARPRVGDVAVAPAAGVRGPSLCRAASREPGVRLVQGPRLVSRADFRAERSLAPISATIDVADGQTGAGRLLGQLRSGTPAFGGMIAASVLGIFAITSPLRDGAAVT